MYATMRDHNQHFNGLAGWGGISASLNAGDSAELVNGLIVTGNFFDVLDVGPAARGRLLSSADDETPGAHPVAVLSYDFWQTRFAGEADVVGREVRLNGHVFTVVGVAPAGFDGPTIGGGRSIYVPMMMQAIMRPPRARYSGDQNPDLLKHLTNSWISVVGRLKSGVSIEQARAELESVASEFVRTKLPAGAAPPPAAPSAPLQPISVRSLEEGRDDQSRQMRSAALLLGGVVGAVLLIACANIANLLLSRASARRREVAVRLALGASRSRLVQQLLTESVLLSLIGGGAGVALAWAATAAFQAAPPPPGALPLALEFPIDQRVLLFSLLLSCATGILFGIAPALETSRPGLVPALKGSDAAAGERRARFDLKKVLVVGEVALSLLLLIAAGLFVRGLQETRRHRSGRRRRQAGLGTAQHQPAALHPRAGARVLSPGCRAGGTAARRRVGDGRQDPSARRQQPRAQHPRRRTGLDPRVCAERGRARRVPRSDADQRQRGRPGLLQDLGISLVKGRDFRDTDAETGQPVVILNATAAAMQFADANPIGNRISVDGPDGPWREIVGVVRDSKYASLSEEAVPVAYLPLAQNHETGMVLYVRASVAPASLVASLRREIQQLDPNLPVPNIRTMSDAIGTSLYAARMGAWLLAVFGGLALALAVVGIYGVLSFSVSRRTREMGIRLALGADTHRVFMLVVRDGMLLVGVGILLGLAGGLAAARVIASSFPGVPATDLPTFTATIGLLGTVALVACAIPARRAIRVNPITALRHE